MTHIPAAAGTATPQEQVAPPEYVPEVELPRLARSTVQRGGPHRVLVHVARELDDLLQQVLRIRRRRRCRLHALCTIAVDWVGGRHSRGCTQSRVHGPCDEQHVIGRQRVHVHPREAVEERLGQAPASTALVHGVLSSEHSEGCRPVEVAVELRHIHRATVVQARVQALQHCLRGEVELIEQHLDMTPGTHTQQR